KKEFSINPIISKDNYFLGFHDIQAFSSDNTKVLSNKLYMDLKMPSKNDFIDVGYFEFDGEALNRFIKIGRSNAWNYHKGCRLQWLGSGKNIIYNSTDDDGNMVAKIVNILDYTETIIST